MINFTLAIGLGTAVASAMEWNPLAVSAVVFAAGSFVKMPSGVLPMAIQKEIWTDYIIKNLFKDNQFLQYCFNADQHVLAGKVVHIPVVGSKPTVVKNRTNLPATVVKRTDTDITYTLDEFTTTPTLIPNADTIELSYDKMDSVLGEHVEVLKEDVAEEILYKWATSTGGSTYTANVIRTTGTDAVAAHTASATGNRKKFVKADLKAAQTLMNKNNIPKNDRYALLDSELYAQLMDDADLIKRDSGGELNLKEGVVMKLYGFHIMERSSVLVYDNATTPVVKAVGAAGAATDNAAALCWQKNAVERALGVVDFFENEKDATYYGDVYSALLRASGRNRREAGVVAIVQAAAE